MATYTLDDIRDAAEKKYGSMEIEIEPGVVVELVNPLRLPKDKRKALTSLDSSINDEDSDDDQGDMLVEAIQIVAKNDAHAQTLLYHVADRLDVMAQIFENYREGTQAGEASASQN